ncbi:hypothetical protein MACK_003139 [Theileria orientalis]|uniref:Uncharacterized protein n=1 Tax=Theileria orientalis TaxID=68886 RepID=A0A976QU82_THEOR|nr:hypothetical protein MACK_003139 [Theileria orientalis]
MKINTISAYVLVYLLARGHWNLMVPVRAVEESDANSSASASADAGLTAGGEAEGSSLATPASESGSSASPDAGSIEGDGSGHVAGGSDADGTAGSSPEGASSGQALTGEVLLNGLYPDLFTSGLYSHKEHGETKPELVAKRQETLLLAEKARKAAEDLRKAAEKLSKEADELDKVIKDTGVLEDFSAKVDTIAYNLSVEASHLKSAAKPSDMMYYSGFPDGHHRYDAGAEDLIERENNWANSITNYTGFPDGHHRYDAGAEDLIERENNWANSITNYSGFPDGWHFGNPIVLRDIRRHELKGEIAAKTKEIETFKKVISDLTTQMEKIDAEVKNLEEEHNELVQKLLGFDALLIKLYKADAEGNPVLMEENTDFEKKKAHGDIRFDFKDGVKCTKVMYGVHELWKKGERDVDEPKLVAFNATVGVIAVRDDDRAVLFKKETSSDKWVYHNTILRQTRSGGTTRTAAQAGSSAGSTLASSSALAGSKMNLEAGSTGTPETPESLEAEETASVASGEGSEPNEADSGSALRGSTGISPGEGMAGDGSVNEASAEGKEGLAGEGVAAADYSSVFMD